MHNDAGVIGLCLAFPFLGLFFSLYYAYLTSLIEVDPEKQEQEDDGRLIANEDAMSKKVKERLFFIYTKVYEGAHSFLYAEYRYISIFVVLFTILIVVVLGVTDKWVNAAFTAVAFIVGCATSVLAGLIGMKIGVFANARTSIAAQESLDRAFKTSFKAAIVMGFVLCSMGLLNLFVLIYLFRIYYKNAFGDAVDEEQRHALFEAVAGYGLGGSCIGLFGRVGGGIYTKAADVGADLAGKNRADLPEDDPRNPAVIADNVGDNVGDIAGMGADLFGSFAEATCAALVIGSQTPLKGGLTEWSQIAFPLTISATGLLVCFLTSFLATHCTTLKEEPQIESTLKRQLLVSTVLMTPCFYGLCEWFLPATFEVQGMQVKNWHVFFCGFCGLWSGLIIGYVTEYYTSFSYFPVRDVAESCNKGGAATNIIYGLALGYLSVIVPVVCLAITIYTSHTLAGFYGIAIAALGILSTLSIGLTIDAFGPICDNAGGLAEMSGMDEVVRVRTDALDAAGNTTAAIGKGFAIGSAALVSLALFSGFITVAPRSSFNSDAAGHIVINVIDPFPFAGLLIGAMLPYWFTAMTMKSVGRAANEMVEEVERQWAENPKILREDCPDDLPDYDRCIKISTDSSLREMFAPGALVMITPLVFGFLLGTECLAGVLCGALVSGVQMAISQSNTGGAWDNAKKYIEKGGIEGVKKGSDTHKAAVVGDTVGDPLKDTSGPSINILIKLMAIISLVFGRAFPADYGGYIGKLFGLSRK